MRLVVRLWHVAYVWLPSRRTRRISLPCIDWEKKNK